MKRTINLLLCAAWTVCLYGVQADELPLLKLDTGNNKVFIIVVNNRNVPVTGLEVIVKSEELPSGVRIGDLYQRLNVPDNSTGSDKFLLEIQVEEYLNGLNFKLPLVLRDANGREWNYTAMAQVGDTSLTLSFKLYQNQPNPFNPSTFISG